MTIRVLFDGQIFIQKYGGISRYFCELLRELEHNPEFTWELGVKCSDNAYLMEIPLLPVKPVTTFENFCFGLNFRGKGRIYQTLEKFDLVNSLYRNRALSEKLLRENRFNIFHPTYYDPYFLELLNGKPFVLTIYDMIHEQYRDLLPAADQVAANKRLLAERADAIIAISESTKADIIRLYGIPPEKISVIHLGSSLCCSPEPRQMNLPEKYVLFIGNRGLYKNFGCFIRAMAQLMSSDRELQVICGGSENFTPAENLLFDELSIAGRVSWRAFANDAELSSLYSHARAFVFPSMYEGFGIPVLEAFACGCPVAVSGCTSLPEVAADAAEYFQPESVDDIARAVSAVVYDTAKSSLLKQRGFERLSHFSWQKTATATISLYQQLLNR